MSKQFRVLILSGAVLLAGMVGLRLLTAWLAGGGPPLPVLGEVGEFAVTNQAGGVVRRADLLGKVWVADLIFTRCPGPCRQLTGVMRKVQDGLPAGSTARLVSVTSDPEFDQPEVLRWYGAKYGADTNRWQFLTGTREAIRELATGHLKLVLQEKAEAERQSPDDLFLHSTLMVVVDRRGRLRAAVEALEERGAERVLEAVRALEREE